MEGNNRVTVGDCCRRLADQVEGVMEEVRSSFGSSDPQVGVSRVDEWGKRLGNDAFRFLSWLERTGHADAADRERGRLRKLYDVARYCVVCDQRDRVERLEHLSIYVAEVGPHFRDWADQIETEEKRVAPAEPPPEILLALAGSRKGLLLFNLLWANREQFIEWDEIGMKVWSKTKEDKGNMKKAVYRLNEALNRIINCEYRAESSNQLGARIYLRTKVGQK